MKRALSRFAEVLRAEGVVVSPGELLDAADAIALVGMDDAGALRAALRITLAKTRADQARVDAAFGRFFTAPRWTSSPRRRRRARRRREAGGGGASPPVPTVGSAAAGLVRHGRARGAPPRETSRRSPTRPLSARRGADRRDPPRRDPDRPAPAGARREAPLAARPERVQRTVVIQAPHRRGDEADRRSGVRGAAPSPLGPPRPSPVGVARKAFRERWSAEEAHALEEALVRALSSLRLRRHRRRARSRRGALWVQRLLRQNVASGGVPFRLVYRRPGRRPPRLLVLVDVSYSMVRAASAFLTLVSRLAREFSGSRIYAFVDRAVDVTGDVLAARSLAGRPDRLEVLLDRHGDLNLLAPSDYARALFGVCEAEARELGHDTIVLVLGDARNNRVDPAAWTLERLAERARAVVWLNPEPVGEWNTGDSVVSAYAPACDLMAEVADVDGLVHALRRSLG